MLDQPGRETVLNNDDMLANCRDFEQLGCEGKQQPDAAMRGWIARYHAGVECGARPGEPLHPRHGCGAINIGVVIPFLLKDAEHASLCRVAAHPGRDTGARDQRRAPVDVDLLVMQGDDESHRFAIGGVRNRFLDLPFGVFTLFGFGRRDDSRERKDRNAQRYCRNPIGGFGELYRHDPLTESGTQSTRAPVPTGTHARNEAVAPTQLGSQSSYRLIASQGLI